MKTKFISLSSSMSEKVCSVVIIFLSMIIPNYIVAQLQIVATHPRQGSILADATSSIEITFDRTLDTNTLSTASVKVYGKYHGMYDLSLNFITSSNILRIQPSPAFIDGESITAILTTALSATDGAALARTFRLAFRTKNPFGNVLSANFEIRDIPLLPGDQQPAKIALGDFNHDDFIDAAVINSTSNTVTIQINTTRTQRHTTLSPTESYATGTTPIDIASADFDADGNLDLAIANFASNDVSIHWGQDDGSFISQPTLIEVGLRPSGIAVDDFNGDGRIEFAVSLLGEDKVSIFTNNGGGSFTRSVELNAEEGTFGVASADYDGDGDVDLAAINNGAQSVSFFQNQNLGGWQSLAVQSVPLKPITMKWCNVLNQTVDGPGDNLQELIVLSSDLTILGKTSSGSAGDKTQFTVFKYEPNNNSFVQAQSFSFGNRAQAFDLGSMDSELASGQFERDHDLDLVLADYVGGSIQYLTNEDNQGWFTSFVSLDESPNPRSVVLADFDRDGDNDILYANHLQNKLRLLWTPLRDCPIYVVNFGDVLVGTTDSLDFAIRLYGSVDVNVNVEVQDEQNFDAAPRSFELRNGQSFPLRLFFSPQDTLNYETKAILITDYPLEELPCFILMRGRGIDVDFNISPSVLDFKTVPPGLSKTLYLHVLNNANGILALTKLENSIPEFTHETDTIYVQPYGASDIPVTFSPQVKGSYLDTLFISSNDITKSRVPILLLGKSATGVPRITSADTATAIEHKFFFYIATAEDPDRDEIEFRFNNFPNWLRASVDSIYGVPPEGAKDSGFTVIASDGFLEDSLDVFLRVIPVNDPPRFEDIDVQQITEQDRLTFTVNASDPEGELLTFSTLNRPQGANFQDEHNNSGTFDWTPPFLSAGTYDVTFFATETVSNPALSDTMIVRIIVGRRKPDIIVSDLHLSHTDIRLNQDAILSAQIKNENAPVLENFIVQILVDGLAVFDSTIVGMEPNESFQINASAKFEHLGTILVVVEADVNKVVPEIDENNNRQTISIFVTRGQLIVRPNPFTPNGDRKNDVAIFDMSQIALSNPILTILDINGRLIQTIRDVQSAQLKWNGKDRSGVEQLPGVYLYILQDGETNVAKGYVVLAR